MLGLFNKISRFCLIDYTLSSLSSVWFAVVLRSFVSACALRVLASLLALANVSVNCLAFGLCRHRYRLLKIELRIPQS
jgi:hypothetical protein